MTTRIFGAGRRLIRAISGGIYSSSSDPTTSADSTAGYRVGDAWFNTTTGNVFDAVSVAAGAAIWRHRPRVLGASGVAVSAGAVTTEETLATVVVPAGAMGANGALRVTALWSTNNTPGNKTFKVKLGATFFFGRVVASTTICVYDQILISNRTASTQVSNQANGTFGISTVACTTGAIDTSAVQNVTLTAQKGTAGEGATLESYMVELIRPDIGA